MDDETQTIEAGTLDLTELTVELVRAYVSNNRVPTAELAALIATTHAALAGLGRGAAPAAPPVEKATPAQIRRSITPDALVSFVDGKPYKTLRRHLNTHGLTFEAYRARYGLPKDYPAVAASYSDMRSTLAKSLGLGRGRSRSAAVATPDVEAAPEPAAAPRKRGRKTSGAEAAG